MSRRYYSAAPIAHDAVRLDDAEAHHLLHVARVSPGDQVVLFDGTGHEFLAEVTRCQRSAVELSIIERRKVCRELSYELTVGVPLPKGDRVRYLVEKLTELGVTRLTPLTTERSEPPRPSEARKLARYVVEASKQCGRNVLMQVAPTCPWATWIEASAGLRLVAHPGGAPLSGLACQQQAATVLGFGPEGGLTAAEVDAAEAAGWVQVDLGPRILRIETAAVAAVSAVTLARLSQAASGQ